MMAIKNCCRVQASEQWALSKTRFIGCWCYVLTRVGIGCWWALHDFTPVGSYRWQFVLIRRFQFTNPYSIQRWQLYLGKQRGMTIWVRPWLLQVRCWEVLLGDTEFVVMTSCLYPLSKIYSNLQWTISHGSGWANDQQLMLSTHSSHH